MKTLFALVVLVLAAIGGAFVFRRMSGMAEVPIEGMDGEVPLTPVPDFVEAP